MGVLIRLTPKEFDLLHYLMVHAGSPIPSVITQKRPMIIT
jgi:DNA-binding response OmpR family regulator